MAPRYRSPILECTIRPEPESTVARYILGRERFMPDLPTILVVEDDHLIQSVVEEALKEGGFDIVIASSGEHAAELLDGDHGKYRALVTDINLGRDKLDGWEVARHA